MAERHTIPDLETALSDLKMYEEEYEKARQNHEKMEFEIYKMKLQTDEQKFKIRNIKKERETYENQYKQNETEISNLQIEESDLNLRIKALEVQCNLPTLTTESTLPILSKELEQHDDNLQAQLEAARLQLTTLNEQVKNNEVAYEKLMDILKTPSE